MKTFFWIFDPKFGMKVREAYLSYFYFGAMIFILLRLRVIHVFGQGDHDDGSGNMLPYLDDHDDQSGNMLPDLDDDDDGFGNMLPDPSKK